MATAPPIRHHTFETSDSGLYSCFGDYENRNTRLVLIDLVAVAVAAPVTLPLVIEPIGPDGTFMTVGAEWQDIRNAAFKMMCAQ